MTRALAALLLCAPAFAVAQQTVAPSRERVGRARGEDHGNYNLLHSYELGVRFHDVDGNPGKYRSDVNFGNGLRLLGTSFSMNSKDGYGRYFDELTLTTQGLGNDPYQFANLRAGKDRWVRYDMLWRSNAYFNPALPVAGGQHAMDTERRLQDHDLTLLPRSRIRFFAGFSRLTQSGPALTTAQLFDSGGGEFPLLTPINRKQTEYRLGNEIKAFGFKLHWLRAWERFEEDTPSRLTTPSAAGGVNLQQFDRREPWRGTTPSWRVNLFREQSTRWAMNARFTHSAGRRGFLLDETAIGADRFGNARNRQVVVDGDARRPVITGHLTLSAFLSRSVAITNHTGYHHTRMEGDARLAELENASLILSLVRFQALGIRNVTNATDLNWRATKWLQLRGGYQFAVRRIRSTEQAALFGLTQTVAAAQTNRLHAGVAGLRLQPARPLSITLDAEIGRQDRPIYPTSDKDYHAFGGRVQWRQRSLTLSGMARTFYNFNSVSLATHSALGRQYSYDASWSPAGWLAFDAGYSKLHSHTATALAYFAASLPVTGERSLWTSNLHAGHLGASLSLRRLDLYLGYSRTQDTSDGRALAAVPPGGAAPGSAAGPFLAVQTFPMLFDSPLARISVQLHGKLRWKAGYQHYRYREDFSALQNYRAHTGFTSLLWTF